MSTPPYSLDLKYGKLVVNQKEKELLNKALDLVIEKGYSFASAEDYMNAYYNTKWKQDFLTRKIEQHSTIGNIYRNGKVLYNTHEPIVTKEKVEKQKEIKQSKIKNRNK